MTSAAVVIGRADAVQRSAKYRGSVHWRQHPTPYFKQVIERAYWNMTGNPCALYRVQIGNTTLYAVNLIGIKDEVKRFLGATE